MAEFFASSYGKIAYTDTQGDGPLLILMHGLPTSKELWSPVLPLLDAKFRIVTFDLNDYGESEKTGQPMSHKARADVLDALRQHLGVSTFVLVAHDLGASVAIDYMGKYADHVQKLVILSPPVYPDFVEPALVKLVRTPGLGELLLLLLKPALLGIGIRQGLVHKETYTPAFQTALNRAFAGVKGRAALMRNLRWGRPHTVFADYPRIIESIAVPTLLIQGRGDPYIPAEQTTRMDAAIADSKLVFIDDGAHFLPIDTPGPVARAINDFVK